MNEDRSTEIVHRRSWDLDIQILILEALNERASGLRELGRRIDLAYKPLSRNLSELETRAYIQGYRSGRKGKKSRIQITAEGTRYLVKRRPLADFVKGYLNAFNSAYSDFRDKGAVETYQDFLSQVSSPMREMLNPTLNQYSNYHDPSLVIRTIPVNALLADARMARERGHFLTANHRYILERLEGISSEDLIQHNHNWKQRVESITFTGRESDIEVEAKTNPETIVRNEIIEREDILGERYREYYSNLKLPKRYRRDHYTFEEPWLIKEEELLARFEEARKRYEENLEDENND